MFFYVFYLINSFFFFYPFDVSNSFINQKNIYYNTLFCCEYSSWFAVFIITFCLLISVFISEDNFKEISLSAFFIIILTNLFSLYVNETLDFNNQLSDVFMDAGTNVFLEFEEDVLSQIFILISNILLPLCVLSMWSYVKNDFDEFLYSLFTIQLILIVFFSTSNLFVFFICFEATLIPIYYLILNYGGRERRIHAAFQFYMYTTIGTILFLMALLYIWFFYGQSDFESLKSGSNFSLLESTSIWLAMALGFAVKLPIFPFHLWLTEAHVEAPTAGSILLAGILLKLGGYGVMKILNGIFDYINLIVSDLVLTISLISLLYTSFSTFIQIDIKKIIAYSSIGHMSFINMALFSDQLIGWQGGLLGMVAHSFVSPALFSMVGFLYERFHTKTLQYYYKLSVIMPVFAVFYFLFTVSNVNFPGTIGFYGELLTLIALMNYNFLYSLSAGILSILVAIYMFFLFVRMLNENLALINHNIIKNFCDLNLRETTQLLFFSIVILYGGLKFDFDILFINIESYNIRQRF